MAAGGRARGEPEAVRITTAATSRHDDIDLRRRRYMFSMAVRTLCFLGAVVVGDNWFRWVLVAGAFILPYIAVVVANTATQRVEGADLVGPQDTHRELQ